jgi:sugar transferase (PEP-CTERM/EpsH1 system associated)
MKVMAILPRVPFPLDKGDKLRAFHQLRELSKHHEIILVALTDGDVDPAAVGTLKEFCSEVAIFRLDRWTLFKNLTRSVFDGRPFQVGYFVCPQAHQMVKAFVEEHRPDHIYCQLIRTAEYAKPYGAIPKTLDYMDAFSKGIQRRIAIDPVYMKPILRFEHKRLLRYESEIFSHFDHATIISDQDRDLIPHPERRKICVVPNGVDTDFLRPQQRDKVFELLFHGNMSYPPNVESVHFLVQKVLPLVWRELPAARLLISGANPSPAVQRLASDRVVVSGWVDDVRENYSLSEILVAPMQISIGLQNKLLEAMAMGLPCITSSLANNALGAISGEQILIADAPEQYAAHIVALLRDEPKAQSIARLGRDYVVQNFSWHQTTALLDDLISS